MKFFSPFNTQKENFLLPIINNPIIFQMRFLITIRKRTRHEYWISHERRLSDDSTIFHHLAQSEIFFFLFFGFVSLLGCVVSSKYKALGLVFVLFYELKLKLFENEKLTKQKPWEFPTKFYLFEFSIWKMSFDWQEDLFLKKIYSALFEISLKHWQKCNQCESKFEWTTAKWMRALVKMT